MKKKKIKVKECLDFKHCKCLMKRSAQFYKKQHLLFKLPNALIEFLISQYPFLDF